MNQYKIIVNHSGNCEGQHFIKDVPIIVSESVVRALGGNCQVLEVIKPIEKAPEKPVQEPAKPATKQIEFAPKDKMMKKPGKSK
ncbi:MAG TPA: hypothetical protein VH186_06295 [Chloroflexia bacterium]|nr:hypothetical protein [Chloroflexia bacterium]